MLEIEDRKPLGNSKNNIIKPAAIPSSITTVQGLIDFLNAGFYADVMANNATSGADVGTAAIGTPTNKALFDSIDEGIYAWPELPELDIQVGTITLTSGWTYVAFTRPFRATPVVVVTPVSSTIINRAPCIKDITVSGFYCTSNSTADTINWAAVHNNNMGI